METELNGYRKNIITEQQRNEQLTMLHNKLQMDMSTVKRHIQTSVGKREQLKTEYSKVRLLFVYCDYHYHLGGLWLISIFLKLRIENTGNQVTRAFHKRYFL